jgi:hypothetical protein
MEDLELELQFESQFIPINEIAEEEQEQEEEQERQSINESDESFSCPVCYTNGAESGLVSPARCSHQICLECYTNIATRAPSPTCPMCRTEYLRTSVEPTAVPNPSPQGTPITTPPRRPMSPNMNSDVMSLLLHNELPSYSVGNIIINTLADIERTQMILDLLNTVT